MQFRNYRKTSLTKARLLTQLDFQQRKGIIQTIHGPATFQVGDYLGRDAMDEYPIGRETLKQNYRKISQEDAEGYACYRTLDIREAVQMSQAFEAGGVRGKPGDYLVKKGTRTWPVDRTIFESSYELVKPDL